MLRHLALLVVCSTVLTACSVASAGPGTAAAASTRESIERGRQFAGAHCAGCHAIGVPGASPHPKAPPFRTLHEQYPHNLEEALADGVEVGHPEMPPVQLDAQQVGDLTAYLKSLS